MPSKHGGDGLNVYLDLVMVLNFLVDDLLLLGTNRLSGFPASPWRCASAAALGAVYSGCCFLPGFRFLGNFLWRIVFLCLMAVIAFGWSSSAVKRGSVFLLLSMAMGGIALSMGRGDFLSLVLCALVCLMLCILSFGDRIGGREYVPLKLTYGDKTVSLIALRDTGNTLQDPVTGEQVLVISAEAANHLTGLTQKQLMHPLEALTRRPIPGLRLIPYHAVGQGEGMLLAKRFDQVTIGDRTQSALVAFAPEGLGRGDVYQALTGGVV